MKKSRFTDSQIIAVLKEAEAGTPVPELCRAHGISSATFYKWRSKFGGMDVSLMTRMKELEEENRRLKKLYVDAQLSADLLRESLSKKMVRPAQRRALAPKGPPSTRSKRSVRPSNMPAARSASASPATAIRAAVSTRTPRWPTGWCG
jgi:putative transposase